MNQRHPTIPLTVYCWQCDRALYADDRATPLTTRDRDKRAGICAECAPGTYTAGLIRGYPRAAA